VKTGTRAKILTKKLGELTKGAQSSILDVSSLTSGEYILKIRTKSKEDTKRLLISK